MCVLVGSTDRCPSNKQPTKALNCLLEQHLPYRLQVCLLRGQREGA
jgi:hypothetical protein